MAGPYVSGDINGMEEPQVNDYYECGYLKESLTVLVVGASGDLAKKKTYPALFSLFKSNYLPPNTTICGFARSEKTDPQFRGSIRGRLKGEESQIEDFLNMCIYRRGTSYSDADSLKRIFAELRGKESIGRANRLFYFAIPPSIFVEVAGVLKEVAMTDKGWNRFIVEKPFGKDSASFEKLNSDISALIPEDDTYRIDHYLGKEMVQNLMVLRFSNAIFEPLWNRNHIACVIISLKENFGTEGRGGYFNQYGIIRDVMQNHLLQMLTMVAMEPPVRATGNYIRDEKVKVLQAIPPIRIEDCVLGQYIRDKEGKEPGYLEDKGVPNDSKTPTFATCVMWINSSRWEGVPFILRAGKALNEKKCEVRIQFKSPGGTNMMFPGTNIPRNELVLRLQPEEAIYMKTNIKTPGLAGDPIQCELDLSFKTRFVDKFSSLPDAYTRLILQVMRGDKSVFVRDDELRAAWRIFTPLLHKIDEGANPIPYEAFTRGPKESDELIQRFGFSYKKGSYVWHEPGVSAKL